MKSQIPIKLYLNYFKNIESTWGQYFYKPKCSMKNNNFSYYIVIQQILIVKT